MKEKILIIDDEFELCMLLKLHLIGKEYEVEMAYTLKDGLDKINTYHPDIIFLDNNLPDGYGWENVPQIFDEHPSVKINLISGDEHYLPKDLARKNLCVMEKPLSKKQIDTCLNGMSENKS